MAQPPASAPAAASLLPLAPTPPPAAPPPSAPASTSTPFAAIDAAIAAVVDNNSADIIGTASALSTAAMNSVENMMKKLRARGRRVTPSLRPLTLDRPFARSPLKSRRDENSLRTGLGVTPPQEADLETARGRSPAPQSISNAFVPSTRTGREVTPPPSPPPSLRTGRDAAAKSPAIPSPTAREPSSTSLNGDDQVYPPLDPHAYAAISPDGSQYSSGYPTAVEPASPMSPASRRQSISNIRVPSTRTGLEVSPLASEITPRSSGYPTAVEPASPLTPASRRQSISNAFVRSTRTGREVTPRQSYEGCPGYVGQEAGLKTGREKSPLGSYAAAGNRQMVSTTVIPQIQHQVVAGQEDAPPGVLLFVHSFYVFSMTLNAWANHFANNNPPAQ